MHILLTTYGLILIFVMFCTAQWRSATDMVFMDTVSIEALAKRRKDALNIVSNESILLYKKHAPKKDSSSSKAVNSKVDSTKAADENALLEDDDEDNESFTLQKEVLDDKKPQKKVVEECSSYLNVKDIFSGEPLDLNSGKGADIFNLLKNLINALYEGQPFFEKAKAKDPEIVEHFIKNLYDKAADSQQEKAWLKSFKGVNKLQLDDKDQNYLRYKTFIGNKSLLDENQTDAAGYFPLTELVAIKKGDKIVSLWMAPKPLLMALFQNPEVVEEVLAARHEIYNEQRRIKAHNKNSQEKPINSDLKLRFGPYIRDFNHDYINFEISGSTPPDMPTKKRQKKDSS